MNDENEYNKYLNPEISERNRMMNELYVELLGHLSEMQVDIPEEKEKKMIMRNVGAYFDSLKKVLIKEALRQHDN